MPVSCMSTTQTKFGYSSAYLPNPLIISSIGTTTFFANWTIEFWFYSSINSFTLKSNVDETMFNVTFDNTNVTLTVSGMSLTALLTLPTSIWYHVAIVSFNNTVAIFIDGSNVLAHVDVVYSAQLDSISIQSDYIDELRIKRKSVYSISASSITIPSSEFSLDNDTFLLNHFNGYEGSTDWAFFDVGLYTPSTNFSTFNYYYASINSKLSSTKTITGNTTSLALTNSDSAMYLRNLISYWNGSWTVEFWINLTTLSNSIIFASSLASSFELNITSSGHLVPKLGQGSSFNINSSNQSSSALTTDTWTHIALVWHAGTYNLYIGGVSVVTITSDLILPSTALNNVYFGPCGGYIANLHISKTARYTSSFTPSNSLITRDYYTLAMNTFSSINDSTEVIDSENSSLVTSVPSIISNQTYATSTSSVLASTAQKQFGSSSLYIPTSGTVTVANLGYNSLTTSWTIEFFVYYVAETIVLAGSNSSLFQISISKTNLVVDTRNVSLNLTTNSWSNVIITYDTSTLTVYINGASVLSVSTLIPSHIFNTITVTSNSGGGYIDELRISRIVRSNSIPSTAFTSDSNTLVLNHFENYAYSQLEFSDDTLSSQYTTSTSENYSFQYICYQNCALSTSSSKYGTASLYFDGASGLFIDNLSLSTSTYWTIEFWFNVTSGVNCVLLTSNIPYTLQIYYNSSTNKLEVSMGAGSSWNIMQSTSTTNTVSLNTWNHVALSYGTSYRFYLNGSQEITNSATTVLSASSLNNLTFGMFYNYNSNTRNYLLTGYIDELHITNERKYSEATIFIVEPSAYLLKSSFSLALNHFDGSNGSTSLFSSENTETCTYTYVYVPSSGAVISTSQYKFGSSSLYLPASSDYLIIRNLTLSASSSVSVEFFYWFDGTVTTTTYNVFSTNLYYLQILSSGSNKYWRMNASNSSNFTFTTKTWYHIVYQKSTSASTVYVNGVSVLSFSDYVAPTTFTLLSNGTSYYDELLIRNSTYSVSVPTNAYSLTTTTLLLNHFEATNNSTNFYITDAMYALGYNKYSSTSLYYNNGGASVTNYYETYNAFVTSNDSKFGSSSLYIDGALPFSYLTVNTTGQYFRGDWTIEFWFKPLTWGENQTDGATLLCSSYFQTNYQIFNILINKSNGKLIWIYPNGGTVIASGGTVVTKNVWHHFAFQYYSNLTTNVGGNFSVYLDGNREIYSAWGTSLFTETYLTNPLIIGRYLTYLNPSSSSGISYMTSLNNFTGYIDDLMISKCAKYSTSTILSYTSQATQSYYTILYNHFENSNLILSEDLDNVTTAPTIESYPLLSGSVTPICSHQYPLFGTPAILINNGYLAFTSLGTNLITGSWTMEMWIKGKLQNANLGSATGIRNYTTNTSAFIIQDTGDWIYIADSYDITTGIRRSFYNSTMYSCVTTDTIYSGTFNNIYINSSSQNTLYINSIKLSTTALYTSVTSSQLNTSGIITIPTSVFTSDANTVFLKSFNEPHGYQFGLSYLTGTTTYDVFNSTNFFNPPANLSSVGYIVYNDFTNYKVSYNINNTVSFTTGEYLSTCTSSLFIDNTAYYSTSGTTASNFSFMRVVQNDNYLRGDFTVEFWFKLGTNLNGSLMHICKDFIVLSNKGTYPYYTANSTYSQISAQLSGTVTVGTLTNIYPANWYHFAAVYTGATMYLYIDGALQITVTNYYLSNITTNSFQFGGVTDNSYFTYYMSLYMNNLRISNTARYTSSFTPSTTLPSLDSNTVALNSFDGTSGSNLLSTETVNTGTLTYAATAGSYSYTNTGTSIVTSRGKFGLSSLYIPTFVTNTLSISGLSTNFFVDTWTIEFFGYGNTDYYIYSDITTNYNVSLAQYNQIFAFHTGNSNSGFIYLNGQVGYFYSFINALTSGFNHYAIVFNGYEILIYVNGTQYDITTYPSKSVITIPQANLFNKLTITGRTGYITNLRISNTARYSGTTTTVPSADFIYDANTFVLNNFNSGLATSLIPITDYFLSANYSVSYNTELFSIFYLLAGASLSTTKSKFGSKSLYFDGSSYCTVCSLSFSTTTWTIEFWFNVSTISTIQTLISSYDSSNTLNLAISTNGKLALTIGTGSAVNGTTTVSTDTWYQMSLVYNNRAYVLYLDGTSEISGTISTSVTPPTNLNIGTNYANTYPMTGYIDELIISSIILHGSNYTVPSSAYTKRLTTTLVLNHFESTTLIDSEDTNFIPQYSYINNDNVCFIIPGTGSNGTSDLINSTGTYFASSITYVNNGFTFSNTYSKFDTTSIYVSGSNSLTINTSQFTTSASKWSLEFFYNPVSTSGYSLILQMLSYTFPNSYSLDLRFQNNTSGKMQINGASNTLMSNVFITGTWYHIAITYDSTLASNNGTFYLNGTSVTNFTQLGTGFYSLILYNGYYNNIRLLNTCVSNVAVPTSTYSYLPQQLSTTRSKFGSSSLALYNGSNLNITSFTIGTSWTIEFWYYTAIANTSYLISNSNLKIIITSSTVLTTVIGGTTNNSSALTNVLNTWNHVALVSNGSYFKLYFNGALAITSGYTTSISLTSLTLGNSFTGYIDELRVSRYAVYTTTFSPSSVAYTASSTTVSLNHFEGTNGSVAFNYYLDDVMIDEYSLTYETASNNNIYQSYGAVLSTTQKKWGSQSVYLDGSTFFTVENIQNTTGNFTVQAWVYVQDFISDMSIFGFYDPYYMSIVIKSTGVILPYIGNGSSWSINSSSAGTTTLTKQTWYHIAFVYTGQISSGSSNGATYNIYINGVLELSFSGTTSLFRQNLIVGRLQDNQQNYNTNNFYGYIDELSISSVSLTSVPTGELSRYTYTLLLNHFESTSLSASEDTTTATTYTNPNTLTYLYTTNCSIYTVSPSVLGSSMAVESILFNNSSDIFTVKQIDNNLLNSTFTIESYVMYSSSSTNALTLNFCAGSLSGTTSAFTAMGIGSYVFTINIPISLNTWYHFAFTYDGIKSINLFIDGVLLYTFICSTNVIQANNFYNLIFSPSQNSAGVYINGFRVSNSVRYTSTYTPPTSFASSDSNTLVLLNIPSTALIWGTQLDLYDSTLNPNIYTSNSVSYYWSNRGATFATVPTNILGNSTALYCNNSSGSTGIINSFAQVVIPSNIILGDFTIEFWCYPLTLTYYMSLFSMISSLSISTGTTITNASLTQTNQWAHIALVFDTVSYISGNLYANLYVNGTYVNRYQGGITSNEISPKQYFFNIGSDIYYGNNFNGYISELRISNCKRYFGNFTVQTSTFTRDMYTIVLNHFNGTNGATNLMSTEDTSVVSFTIPQYTTYYQLQYQSNGTPYTGSKIEFSSTTKPFANSSGSLWTGAYNVKIYGIDTYTITNTWTYELWFMLPQYVSSYYFLYNANFATLQLYISWISGTNVQFSFFGSRYVTNGFNYSASSTINLNTWYHIAVTFDGTGYNLYLNGTLLYNNNYFNKMNSAYFTNLQIGTSQYYSNTVTTSAPGAYITQLRISNTCRYNSNFTPLQDLFTYDSNTVVLNSFGSNLNKLQFYDLAKQVQTVDYDNTGANDTWYLSKNASLSTVQKKFGTKSLYLTGSYSYLRVFPSVKWNGPYTIQLWFCLVDYVNSENPYLIQSFNGSSDLGLYINSSTNVLQLQINIGYSYSVYTGTTTISKNTWNHVALCYDPDLTNKYYVYLNGALDGTFSSNNNSTAPPTGMTWPLDGNGNGVFNSDMTLSSIVVGRRLARDSLTSNQNSLDCNSFYGYLDELIVSNYPKFNSTTLPALTQKTRDQYDLVFNTFEGASIMASETTPVTYVYSPVYSYSFTNPIDSVTSNTTLTNTQTNLSTSTSLSFVNDAKRTLTISNLLDRYTSYTIEFFLYIAPIVNSTDYRFIQFTNNTGVVGSGPIFYINSNYTLTTSIPGATSISNTVTVTPNKWNHFVLEFDIVTEIFYVYLNGTLFFIGAMIGSYTTNFSRIIFSNYASGQTTYNTFYLNELRISNCLRYSTTYTVPTSQFSTDSNTLLLNHFDGANGSNNLIWYNDPLLSALQGLSFVTNSSGIYFINNGGKIASSPTKFGSGSLNINGSSYLVLEEMSFSTTEWTLELWFYPTSSSGCVLADYTSNYKLAVIYNTYLYMYVGNGNTWSIANGLNGNTSVTSNAWHHVAFVFTGLKYLLYLDGILQTSVSSTTNIY